MNNKDWKYWVEEFRKLLPEQKETILALGREFKRIREQEKSMEAANRPQK